MAPFRRSAPPLLLAATLAAAMPAAAQSDSTLASSAAPAPLFATHEPLDLTLIADFARLEDDRGENNPLRPAELQLAAPDGTTITLPLEVRTRGGFRLRRRTCPFPNLRLEFPARTALDGTPFAGQGDLKLVGHCRPSRQSEQDILEEYLVYRLYNLLTDVSLRVRLARITYLDLHGRSEPLTRYGFLLEDVDDLAERLGGHHLEVQGVDPHALDPLASTRVELFQYMIGNTDFSVVNFHNAELIRMPDGTYHPVPYDFDFAGFVDAPYARPSAILNTRSVRERVYRGFCRLDVDMAALFDSFLSHRAAFNEVIRNQKELEAGNAERAIRYLDGFFETIESPRARRILIERQCRTHID